MGKQRGVPSPLSYALVGQGTRHRIAQPPSLCPPLSPSGDVICTTVPEIAVVMLHDCFSVFWWVAFTQLVHTCCSAVG